MITVPMTVSATTATVDMSVGTETPEVPLTMGTKYVMEAIRDYERLENKPKINGVELVGNKFLADLFPDGIIIDGGGA